MYLNNHRRNIRNKSDKPGKNREFIIIILEYDQK